MCVMSMIRGSVLLNKPLAWAIFSGDQVMAYLTIAAVGAAAQSDVFAKFGQTQLEWMQICSMYGKFCNQVAHDVDPPLITSPLVLGGVFVEH
ncbi:hypothetical protein CASFOL_040596 [Castilleja foliolosa]|uniref:CASP-like protein n=1 Tax=Castilleja foliolosa TaxID=1961234 RepID=A0ABD3BDL6_9LAMI